MKHRPIPPLALAALALSAASVASAAGPLQITTSMMVEARTAAADGTTRVTLVKPVRVTPGDRVVVVLAWRNTAQAVKAGILTPALDHLVREQFIVGRAEVALEWVEVKRRDGNDRGAHDALADSRATRINW